MAGYATPAWTNNSTPAIDAASLTAIGQGIELGEHPYGVCSTAASTAAKTVTIDFSGTLTLFTGLSVRVKFSNANTAASPTLNVNGTGAKPILFGTGYRGSWIAGAVAVFTYDGTNWVMSMPFGIDAAPTDGSANLVSSTGIKTALSDLKSTTCTTNLLDNWYFPNPVNQRNQTVYTGTASYFDRWRSTNSRATATIQSGYLNFACTGTGGGAYLRQYLDGIPAGTYSVSALVRGTGSGAVGLTIGTVLTSQAATFTLSDTTNWACVSAVITVADVPDTFTVRADEGSSIDILAVKLELGESQTLASQVNGSWQLNYIPNFQQELAKCQRYLFVANMRKYTYITVGMYAPASNTTTVYPIVLLPVPLRASSVDDITISDYSGVVLRPGAGSTNITPSAITAYRVTDNMIKLRVTASGLTAGELYDLSYVNSASSQFIISCEL